MNKYQEALNKLKHRGERFGQDLYDTAKDEIDILQDLIDQNKPLTLEECIKEWEEDGFTFYKGGEHIHFRIYNDDGSIDAEYIFHPTIKYYVVFDTHVPFERFQLISKTLKALEAEDDK